jgi:NADPH:quinone reductase-like Zn-dependent oxidoreductase
VDLVLDVAGAPYFGDNLASLRRGGRLVLIGFLGGAGGDLDLGPILRKNLTVTGTTLRATPVAEKARLVREFGASALPGFSDGTLKPLVDRVFRWEEAGEAHAYMEADRNAGALVLRVGS